MNMPTQSIGEQPPHGVKELIPYAMSWDEIVPKLLILLGILTLCVLCILLWRKYRKKKVVPVIQEDPFVVLQRRLANLLPPEPFEGKKCVQYFFDLNMIFREFIELGTGIPATDLTLQELREPLRSKTKLSREIADDFLQFLERCEYIKFAGLFTEIHEAKQSHSQVTEWVKYLKPHTPPPSI